MSSIEQPVEIAGDKLQQFVFRAVNEAGGDPRAAEAIFAADAAKHQTN